MKHLVDPETDQQAGLAASLIGRTVVDAVWCDLGGSWGDSEYAILVLDDGRVIQFGAWGHDAWGATISESRTKDYPKSVRDRLRWTTNE